ncbi:MAG: C4-dicarboxylate transporter DcuC [Lachnospiraceae bacterium]|nr:C4-dicarboxylate transporter DcuC [Lachnospiraceae bacterium]
MINLIISLIFVFLAVFLLQKKLPNTVVFLVLSVFLAIIYEATTGLSAVSVSSGSMILDIFETFKEQLVSSFASVGLSMLPIFGYSVYMEKINASVVLGSLVAKPVSKAKNPYFVGVFVAIIICSIMRIAIVSAFAILALLFSTLYPAMLRAGLSRKTAMAALFLGTCFDWGPADFVVAIVLGGAGVDDIPGYFLNASVKVTPIVIIITALISGFIMQYFDKKEGYVLGSDAPSDDDQMIETPPKYYAVLPLLPMFLIIIFSKVFFASISISVVAAVLISIIITAVIESINKGNIPERLSDIMVWFTGMGNGFANLFLMVASVQLFSNLLSKLNGFTWLIQQIASTGISGWILIFIAGAFVILMAVLIGEPSAVTAIIANPVKIAAESLGIPFFAAIYPIQVANSFRCLSLGTGPHIQYCCKQGECNALDISKRTAVPCIIIFLLSFLGAYFILG